jgi:hypothetical protein
MTNPAQLITIKLSGLAIMLLFKKATLQAFSFLLVLNACGGGGSGGSGGSADDAGIDTANRPTLVLNAPATTNIPYQATISVENFTIEDMNGYSRLCFFGGSSINFNETWKSPKEDEIDSNKVKKNCYTTDSSSSADTQMITAINEIEYPIEFEQPGGYKVGAVLYDQNQNTPSYPFNDISVTPTGGASVDFLFRHNSDRGLSDENTSRYVFRPQPDGSLFYYQYIHKYNSSSGTNTTKFWSLYLIDAQGGQQSELSLQEDFGFLGTGKVYDTDIMTFDDEYLYIKIKNGNILRYLRSDYRSATPVTINMNITLVADNSFSVPLNSMDQLVMMNDSGNAYLYGSYNNKMYRVMFQSGMPGSAEHTQLPANVIYMAQHQVFSQNNQYYDLMGNSLADCTGGGNIFYNRDTASYNCVAEPDYGIGIRPDDYCSENLDISDELYCMDSDSFITTNGQIHMGQAYIEENSMHLIIFSNDYERFYNSQTLDWESTSWDDSLLYFEFSENGKKMRDEISLYPVRGAKNDVDITYATGVKQTLLFSSLLNHDLYLLIGERSRQIQFGGAITNSYYQQHMDDYKDMNYLRVSLNQDKTKSEVLSVLQTKDIRDTKYDGAVTFKINDPEMDTSSPAAVYIGGTQVTVPGSQVLNADGTVEISVDPSYSGKGEMIYAKQGAYYQKIPITVSRNVP